MVPISRESSSGMFPRQSSSYFRRALCSYFVKEVGGCVRDTNERVASHQLLLQSTWRATDIAQVWSFSREVQGCAMVFSEWIGAGDACHGPLDRFGNLPARCWR